MNEPQFHPIGEPFHSEEPLPTEEELLKIQQRAARVRAWLYQNVATWPKDMGAFTRSSQS